MLEQPLARASELLNSLRPHQNALPPVLRGIFEAYEKEYASAGALELPKQISLIQRTRRLAETILTGAFDDRNLTSELVENQEPVWSEREDLDVDPVLVKTVAEQLFRSSGAKKGEKIVIATGGTGKSITEEVIRLCAAEGVDFEIDFQDDARQAILVKHLENSEAGRPGEKRTPLQRLADLRLTTYREIRKMIDIRSNQNSNISRLSNKKKDDAYREMLKEISGRRMSGDLFYTLTMVPTPADAERDHIPYKDYLKLYFEACDQPWEAIETAQEILKGKLDEATSIHIVNEDGTDVTLDITGQTFANSVVAKNIPGAEVFSAPRKEGVNGKIVAKGKFQFRDSGIIEDITLIFQNGRIIDLNARVGREALAAIVEGEDGQDAATRFLGEIGFGTNPHLRRQLLNPLLVEKVGGSFHVAIGSCYKFPTYGGKPVQLKNGNTSSRNVHWDLTTLLRGQKSQVALGYADGRQELVQENGKWLVEGCDVLNEGWGAMPENERPEWFKRDYPNGYPR